MSADNNVTDLQQVRTLPQLIRVAAATWGDATAIVLRDGDIEERLTYQELERRSALLARGLIARGVGKGSRIGFIYGNGPSFALVFAAITRAGAVAVPVSTFIKASEMVRVLRQADISGLLLQRSLLGKDYVARLCEALPALRTSDADTLRLPEVPFLRWVVSTGDALPQGIHDQQWLVSAADTVSEELLQAVEAEIFPSDQVMEIYTSGSMAMPKGVRHNHGPLLFRSHYLAGRSPLKHGAENLAVMPMFWVGGMMMYLLPHLLLGVTTVCTESTATNSRIAMGSVVAPDDMYEIPQGVTIWALGMTETLGPYSYADQLRVPGYPLCPPLQHIADRFEVRVVDEQDRPMADGEVGEIQVRGYALTPGLHKIEKEEYLTADGFYRTGDLGQRDGQCIHFVGRSGDMIKTANTNVSPAEVEEEMQRLDGVHSAYVVGIPDAERGQLVVAAVVPREGAQLDFTLIQRQLTERLSSFKVPRAYVALPREEIPMLPSNKVARRQIERLMIDRLGRQM